MKTENTESVSITSAAVIWDTNVELPHITTTECLPIIGSSQVSSILSTLDSPEKVLGNIEMPQMELIVLQNAEVKLTSQPIVATNLIKVDNDKKSKAKKTKTKNLTYIVCDLCPFLCLKEKNISEHIELVHKNKKPSQIYEMKCPACVNVFYHKLSMQAHLTYDHCVSNTADVARIIQVALHTKQSAIYSSKLPMEIDLDKTPIIIEGIQTVVSDLNPISKSEIDIKLNHIIEANQVDCDFNGSNDIGGDCIDESVNLPTLDMSQNNAENLINSYIKKPLLSKFLYDKKVYKCTFSNCKVRMMSVSKLNYHISCHSDTLYKCPECSETFSLWQPLTGHLWRIHKIDMELYSCDKCEYRTHSLSKLNNTHKLIHGTYKAFICEICEKKFKNAKQLRNHKDTHKALNSNTYECSNCDKVFSFKHLLRNHIDSVHKKLKPFLCNYCGYKGGTKGALKIHIRQHTGEKPFTCDKCEYTTADHNSLRRHKLRHSGDKPYKCTHCDYECIQSSTYKVHIKTKHPGLDKELLFSCPICQFRSINKEVYNLHMSSQHPEIS